MSTRDSSLQLSKKKLNVGCGFDIREDYLNVDNEDYHNPDLVADITNLPMLPDGRFDEILAQDVLEHVDRTKQISTLKEWGRLLSRDGVLKVRVPSLTDMLALAYHPEWQNEDKQTYLIQMVYGTQAYPGDYHRCGYTPFTISALARDAGLIVIYAGLRDTWLYDLIFKKIENRDALSSSEIVHNAYFCFGHRVADPQGIAYWSDRIDSGASSQEVIDEIVSLVRCEHL